MKNFLVNLRKWIFRPFLWSLAAVMIAIAAIALVVLILMTTLIALGQGNDKANDFVNLLTGMAKIKKVDA